MTSSGRVFTWGNYAKSPIQGLGNAHGKAVTWIGTSADQTILKLDESLINAQNLVGATICSNKHQVLLLPTHNQQPTSFHSLCISRSDGFVKVSLLCIKLNGMAELRLLILCTMYCGSCVEKQVPFNVTTQQPMTLSLRVNSASCHQILPFLSLQDALSQDLRRH